MTAAPDTDATDRALAVLAPIGLDDLVERAALQSRVDRKYVLRQNDVAEVLRTLGPDPLVLEIDGARRFAYESVYFDTPDLTSFHLAAHRRRRRFKVRTRRYVDTGGTWLEVKTRGARGTTVKHRAAHPRTTTLDGGRRFVEEVLAASHVDLAPDVALDPVLVTRYDRTTLCLPEDGAHRTATGDVLGDGPSSARATLDTGLGWSTPSGTTATAQGLVIVETKTGSTPSALDRALWRHGHRPVSISKYGTGLALLHPDLPRSRWQPVLRRHLAGTTAPRPATGLLATEGLTTENPTAPTDRNAS